MLNDILNLEGVAVLDKKQQSEILGGDGPCRIYVQNSSGQGYWSSNTYSVDQAQFYFSGTEEHGHGWTFSNGFSTTRYCCASCEQMGAPSTEHLW